MSERWQDWGEGVLARTESEGLWRNLLHPQAEDGLVLRLDGKEVVNFCSNDYLGFRFHPDLRNALVVNLENGLALGAGASRFVSGSHPLHFEAEAGLAELKGTAAARLFSSGYLANIGALTSLLGEGDFLFSDELNHASLIDGARLCRAKTVIFPHNDIDHLRQALNEAPRDAKKMVVVESVYSMDGDLAPLEEIAAACVATGALLMVDEAHATGVFGVGGRGLAHSLLGEFPELDLLIMGTLSKSFGLIGGFVAGEKWLVEVITQRARTGIFDTALPPCLMPPLLMALGLLKANQQLGQVLLKQSRALRDSLQSAGIHTGQSDSQIIPLMVGEESRAVKLAEELLKRGFLVRAIRPPTVPRGSSRLRLTLSLLHQKEQVEGLEAAIREVFLG